MVGSAVMITRLSSPAMKEARLVVRMAQKTTPFAPPAEAGGLTVLIRASFLEAMSVGDAHNSSVTQAVSALTTLRNRTQALLDSWWTHGQHEATLPRRGRVAWV